MKKYLQAAGLLGAMLVGVLHPVEARAATVTLVPTGDVLTQWSVQGGPSHFSVIDDDPCNISDFVHTSTPATDIYSVDISSIPAGSTITDISLSPCAGKISPAGISTLTVGWAYSGIATESFNYFLTSQTMNQLPPVTSSGLTMPRTGTNDFLQVYAYSGSSSGVRMSNYLVTVTYTP